MSQPHPYGSGFPDAGPPAPAGPGAPPPSGVRTAAGLAYVIAALDLIGIAISFTTLDDVRASARTTDLGTTSEHTVVVIAVVGFIVYGVIAAALWRSSPGSPAREGVGRGSCSSCSAP